MLLVSIGLYLLLTIAIGWWASRRVKNTSDFVMAGRSLPLVVAGAALFATWFGSETIMGAPSRFVDEGMLGIVEDPFGAALCLILVGAFFARKFYEMNILTFVDFFRIRYSRTAELVSAILIVPSYFGWIAAQLVAMAVVLTALTGIPFHWGIIGCTAVVVFYTYIGGMWAVSITDFIQTIIIIIGLVILAVYIGHAAGGFSKVIASTPEGFFRFLPEGNFNSIAHYFAAWITIGLGSIPQQDVFQRVMSAKDAKTSVRASYIGGFMYLTIGFIPLFIALAGRTLYSDMAEGDPQMMVPMMVLRHAPMALQVLFFGALLSAILSTTSGAMLAPATIIGENLVRPYFKNVSDQRLLTIMRMSVVFVAVLSAVMASWSADIFELVGQSSAFSLVSLFFPMTLGMYWKRSSTVGALASMIAGLAVWLFFEIRGSELPSLLHGALVGLVVMVAGSLIWPDKGHRVG
ncbi:MAG: sodium:solute symporter family protein [Saprospiraceae bacterium]|nr:sodium:solute symporter family protein [Saprospiraceae bacterium]HRK81854.1 sodium:solute symporter family protein [Saprospiraceae bacterium]